MSISVYNSFVVRLFGAAIAHGAGVLKTIEVEHIQSGKRWSFATLEHMIDFLRLAAESPQTLILLASEED
jgi:hypothetical protein